MVILGMARADTDVVAEAMKALIKYIPACWVNDPLDTMRRADQFMAALPSILGPVYRCVIDFGKYDHRHIMRRKIRRCYK